MTHFFEGISWTRAEGRFVIVAQGCPSDTLAPLVSLIQIGLIDSKLRLRKALKTLGELKPSPRIPAPSPYIRQVSLC